MSVSSLLADAKSYTRSLVTDAEAAMSEASSSVAAVGYSIPNYQPATLPNAPPSAIDTTVPTLADITLEMPAEPTGSLVFQDISPFEAGTAPTFDGVSPTITLPTSPNQVAEFVQTAPGIDTAIAFPEPPSALLNPLIEAPVLPTRVEPDAPQVSLPAFTSVAPADTTVAPTNIQQQFENAYAGAAPNTIAMLDGYVDAMLAKYNPRYAEQMGAIEDQIATYMAGGTGLKPAVEAAIYARAQERNDAEAKRQADAVYNESAARGFTIPTGALNSQIQRLRQDSATANNKTSNEIIVMQAEMEQKNLQFAVTTSAGLRTALLNASLSYHQNLITINGQALDYAKTVMSAIIEVYNTAVKAFTVKLEAYKADAVVYETRLKAAMSGIELYRAEISALEALANVDKSKVDIYRARIESLTSLSNVYRAQIEAVQGRVGLEKLKLDVFQAQVQAYSTQVQAKSAEWQGYTAAIGGQTAKAQMFASQVQAYTSEVNGYKATVEAKGEVVRAIVAANQARATQYQALMNGYQTVVQARGEKARTQIQAQGQVILAYQAKVQASIGNAQVQQGYYKAVADVAVQNAQSNLKAQLGEIESKRAYSQTIAQLGTANATIFGNLASSAMAGMNTLAAETLAS